MSSEAHLFYGSDKTRDLLFSARRSVNVFDDLISPASKLQVHDIDSTPVMLLNRSWKTRSWFTEKVTYNLQSGSSNNPTSDPPIIPSLDESIWWGTVRLVNLITSLVAGRNSSGDSSPRR